MLCADTNQTEILDIRFSVDLKQTYKQNPKGHYFPKANMKPVLQERKSIQSVHVGVTHNIFRNDEWLK